MDILSIILRTILIIIVLFILGKIMGKKQVSQMNIYDYIIGITIGSIAADVSLDLEKNLLAGVISLSIYGLSGVLISYLTMKNISFRRFICGVPTILIEEGKIIESGLKKSQVDINDLLSEARINGYFNISDIETAIMEMDGKISFQPKESLLPATKKDMKITTSEQDLTTNVIIDTTLLENNLKEINKTKEWLDKELKKQNYNNYNNILLATIDKNNQVTVYNKGVKPTKSSVLE
jgi:uncharacterized membrane protein YcaP (DUF421 family)